MRLPVPFVLAAAAVALATGCGSNTTRTITETAPPGTLRGPATATSSTASGSAILSVPPARGSAGATAQHSGSPTEHGRPGATAHGAPVARVSAFRSPTGNIGCLVSALEARCDIRRRGWSAPPRPRSCPLAYGQGLSVGSSGRGRFVCAGDTVLDPSAHVLAYGAASAVGALRCQSAVKGVTCANSRTVHGFSISAQSYRVF